MRPIGARIAVTVALVGIGVVLIVLPMLLRHGRVPELSFFYADSAAPAPGAALPDSAEALAALGRVLDPELRLSVVELGLVDSLAVDAAGNIRTVLALTTPECPYLGAIGRSALTELRRLPGARRVQVRLEPNSRWDPSRLTDEGRRRFREVFGDSAGR